MARDNEKHNVFDQQDHQVAYIFDPNDGDHRATKRRRVSKKSQPSQSSSDLAGKSVSQFVPLLSGAETPEFVALREQLFEEHWGQIETRIKETLRDSNSATLDQVTAFVDEANSECYDKISAAFIITGSNIASQNLLFEQLSESLQSSSSSKFVRIRSSEASSLKATLKKIIRDVTAQATAGEDEDLQVAAGEDARRRYLDYDLEALYSFIRPQKCKHVFVAFEDSESFDSALFSDLISLLKPRIPFTLLFGIATSVELLQARLLKSTCQQIHGAQFDVVQSGAILETVVKVAVAAGDVPLCIGGNLLSSMLERQSDQVAGVQSFASSLKYAYMCHFYSNALSFLPQLHEGSKLKLQSEHLEAIRNLASFRALVEQTVEAGTPQGLTRAESLLEDDAYLLKEVQASVGQRQDWIASVLRALMVIDAAGAQVADFSQAYASAIAKGIAFTYGSSTVESVRRMDVRGLMAFLGIVISIFREGRQSLNLGPSVTQEDIELCEYLGGQLDALDQLRVAADKLGIAPRSKYNGQNKVHRTTVIAQRVQLSKDTATLRDEDKQFTKIVDDVVELLTCRIRVAPPGKVFLSESWIYDSKSPARDVFVPRPRVIFERSLTRSHDYLGCACCQPEQEGIQSTLPPASILYQLYLETGSLINVADLWSAFQGHVSQTEEDERKVLLMFYRSLAELRALGFVKNSTKKADHIAKLKWL